MRRKKPGEEQEERERERERERAFPQVKLRKSCNKL